MQAEGEAWQGRAKRARGFGGHCWCCCSALVPAAAQVALPPTGDVLWARPTHTRKVPPHPREAPGRCARPHCANPWTTARAPSCRSCRSCTSVGADAPVACSAAPRPDRTGQTGVLGAAGCTALQARSGRNRTRTDSCTTLHCTLLLPLPHCHCHCHHRPSPASPALTWGALSTQGQCEGVSPPRGPATISLSLGRFPVRLSFSLPFDSSYHIIPYRQSRRSRGRQTVFLPVFFCSFLPSFVVSTTHAPSSRACSLLQQLHHNTRTPSLLSGSIHFPAPLVHSPPVRVLRPSSQRLSRNSPCGHGLRSLQPFPTLLAATNPRHRDPAHSACLAPCLTSHTTRRQLLDDPRSSA